MNIAPAQMTGEALQERKAELEHEILSKVEEFERETGTLVEELMPHGDSESTTRVEAIIRTENGYA